MAESIEDFFSATEEWAVRAPRQVALASRGGYMNYEDLVGNIASAAVAASQAGIGPGQLVVVGVGRPDMALVLAFALLRIGCRVGYTRDVSLYESSGVAIDAVIADQQTPPSRHRTVSVGPQWFAGAQARWPTWPPAAACSMIVSTSGSTGRPKLIERGAAVLVRDSGMRTRFFFSCPQPRVLSAFGGRTSPNFYDAMAALAGGGTVITPVDRSDGAIVDTIQLFRPDHMTLGPAALDTVLRGLETRPALIRKLQVIRLTGAYCSPRLQREALERMSDELIMTYGCSETGLLAWGRSRDLQTLEQAVGHLFDDVEVAAFDADGQRLGDGSLGEIRARVPDKLVGMYLGSEGPESPLTDGWFRTGDIGLVDAARNLIISGRASNVINIGGSKVSPEALEESILTMANVAEVGVAGVDLPQGYQKVCAAIVSASNPSIEAVNAHLARLRQPWPVQAVKRVDAIPRTDNGKIDRVALKRLCAE